MKKCLVLSALAGAMLLVGGGAAYMALAQTSSTQVTACARPNGDVYLIGPNFSRQTCQGQQVQISWPTLAGTPKKLSYYDANNNYLGQVVRGGSVFESNYLYFTAYNESLDLLLSYTGDIMGSGLSIYSPSYASYNLPIPRFTEDNCSGEKYFDLGTVFQPQTLVSVDGIFYRGSTSSEQFTHHSSVNYGSCINVTPTLTTGYRMIEVNLPGHIVSPVNPIRVVETQF
jgi:hypothetical protein